MVFFTCSGERFTSLLSRDTKFLLSVTEPDAELLSFALPIEGVFCPLSLPCDGCGHNLRRCRRRKVCLSTRLCHLCRVKPTALVGRHHFCDGVYFVPGIPCGCYFSKDMTDVQNFCDLESIRNIPTISYLFHHVELRKVVCPSTFLCFEILFVRAKALISLLRVEVFTLHS